MIRIRVVGSVWRRLLVAVLAVGLAAGLRLSFVGPHEARALFVTFYPAVMLAALAGGLHGGLLATVLSAFLTVLWLPPTGFFRLYDTVSMIGLGIFILSSAVISYLVEALYRAMAQAEAASKAKSDFLANMSHELRTPMNGILGSIELALMRELSPVVRSHLETGKQSALHLLDILNDVLDLSRIEAGRFELQPRPFELDRLVADVVGTLASIATRKGLDLRHGIDPEVPSRLMGDAVRLRQILMNLIGNALKFTGHGRILVNVEGAGQTSDGRVRVRFTVRDTGIGIPPDSLGRIFESFSRESGATQARYGGTGLGLAISKRLVEMMGGDIWVESAPGQGSCFYFTALFDKADTVGTVGKLAKPKEKAWPKAAAELAPGLRILLAEDNEINRLVAVDLLQAKGHQVKAVENGEQALAALRRETFDLVLMDVRMPVMDGEEATRAIREGQAGDPEIPIVALTAHALTGDRERFLAAGMDDYISKPFDPDELERTIARVLVKRDRPSGA